MNSLDNFALNENVLCGDSVNKDVLCGDMYIMVEIYFDISVFWQIIHLVLFLFFIEGRIFLVMLF